jgi:hypothetical protein
MTTHKFLVTRRGRAAWWHWEWHNHGDVKYIMFGASDPYVHRWWSTTVYLYLPKWANNTLLNRIPSTGWRAWGDNWAPANPWSGKYRPWRRKKVS